LITLTKPIIGVAGVDLRGRGHAERRRLVAERHASRADEIRAQDLNHGPRRGDVLREPVHERRAAHHEKLVRADGGAGA
jgi:hypothetical protein